METSWSPFSFGFSAYFRAPYWGIRERSDNEFPALFAHLPLRKIICAFMGLQGSEKLQVHIKFFSISIAAKKIFPHKRQTMKYAIACWVLGASLHAAYVQAAENSGPSIIRFDISRFDVQDNAPLSSQEMQALLAPFVGKNRDFGDVQRALEEKRRVQQVRSEEKCCQKTVL